LQVRILPGPLLGASEIECLRREKKSTSEFMATEQSGKTSRGPARASEIVSFVPRTIEFVKEAWQELKKVHWPTLKETQSATLIVIVAVVVVSIYLGVVDFALSYTMQYIMGQP
jgi:preprotein translocase subunit SecE